MKKTGKAMCAACDIPPRERICMNADGKSFQNCPTMSKKRLSVDALKAYRTAATGMFARQASIQEGECYGGRDQRPYVMHPVKPRIQETWEFARKMGYTRLGLVFCIGLAREAAVIDGVFRKKGFEVVSVACKVGGVPKEELGIREEEKIFIGNFEVMCNPILQALVVNDAQTDFNILVGLCVGHDSLFLKHADAPSTVLAVKDRLSAHNPLAPVYTSATYGSWIDMP